MDRDELAEIEARANAATPGPWTTHVVYRVITPRAGDDGYLVADCGASESPDCCEGNAPFIAHARTDVPALVAEVRRLAADLRAAREEVERLRGELAEAQATIDNERGEGEPPEVGWVFEVTSSLSPLWRKRTPGNELLVQRATPRGWYWSDYHTGFTPRNVYPTARAAIRAATKVVRWES